MAIRYFNFRKPRLEVLHNMRTWVHELDEFLSSDVKNDGAERQMKNEEWRIKVNNEIRLIRVIRCEKQFRGVL